jgi:hypothetical protein
MYKDFHNSYYYINKNKELSPKSYLKEMLCTECDTFIPPDADICPKCSKKKQPNDKKK